MILELVRATGTLGSSEVAILTIPDPGQGAFSVRLYGTFCNKSAATVTVQIKVANKYVWHGDFTNSPLKGGQTLEMDMKVRIQAGETVVAWVDSGGAGVVDYMVTAGVVPEPALGA